MGRWQYPHQRLSLSLDEYHRLLTQLYNVDKLSHKEIGGRLAIHPDTIRKNCKQFGIQPRSISEIIRSRECKRADLTKQQCEALDGVMLADGHLDGHSTVSARLTYGCKFRETLVDLKTVFSQMHFSNPWRSKTGYWHFKSAFYTDLRHHWKRWYRDDKKIVPPDLTLSPLCLYWWFIGDGYQVDYGINFCTDNFTTTDNDYLCLLLTNAGFEARTTPSNRIRVCGSSVPRLLQFMKENTLIATQYAYKWGRHCRQSTIPNRVWPSKEELQQAIITESTSIIGRRYDVCGSTITKWLKKHGLINPRRKKFYR